MIEAIENIKVKAFFELPTEVLLSQYCVLRMLKQKNTHGNISVKSVELLPYGLVVNLRKVYIEQTAELIITAIEEVFKIDAPEQMKMDILDYFPLVNFILAGTEKIVEMEKRMLQTPSKPELEAAGVEDLQKYGELITIDNLSGGDILRHHEIEQLPWRKVFTKLCLEKDKAEVQERYAEIIKSKQTQTQ